MCVHYAHVTAYKKVNKGRNRGPSDAFFLWREVPSGCSQSDSTPNSHAAKPPFGPAATLVWLVRESICARGTMTFKMRRRASVATPHNSVEIRR
jgi:hypothetical protein